jgi:hypothetical protein
MRQCLQWFLWLGRSLALPGEVFLNRLLGEPVANDADSGSPGPGAVQLMGRTGAAPGGQSGRRR